MCSVSVCQLWGLCSVQITGGQPAHCFDRLLQKRASSPMVMVFDQRLPCSCLCWDLVAWRPLRVCVTAVCAPFIPGVQSRCPAPLCSLFVFPWTPLCAPCLDPAGRSQCAAVPAVPSCPCSCLARASTRQHVRPQGKQRTNIKIKISQPRWPKSGKPRTQAAATAAAAAAAKDAPHAPSAQG